MSTQKSTYKTIADLRPNESAVVKRITDPHHSLATRLCDLGLTPNSPVTCVMKSPLGDPSAYLIRGAVIAIRKRDAEIVAVSEDIR